MRYFDSASRNPADTLYTWLNTVLPEATYFGCQTGYFSYDGVFPLESHLVDVLSRSGQLRLVVPGHHVGDSRVVGVWPPSAVWRRSVL